MNRLKMVIVVMVLASFVSLYAQNSSIADKRGAKINIAVSSLDGRGLAEGEASTLTDALSSYLTNTGVFRVMERGRMDIILQEQGFQQSGACTDAACIVEMGQLLGVDNMIAGSVGKVGQTYSVNLRMISVATGEILRSLSKFYKGEIDGVLTDVLPAVANDLAASDGTTVKPSTVIPATVPTPKAATEPAIEGSATTGKAATPTVRKSRKWPWVLLGMAIIGGAAFFIIQNESEQTGEVEMSWPTD